MKQLIIPIAIIVALIAFFVIIDRKDFYSTGDVAVQKEDVTRKPTSVTTLKPVEQPKETKPAEVKPMETKPVAETMPAKTKPADVKPSTVKPVETKPVAETKPIETKPVVETKPAEVKTVEIKPPETTPVTEAKPEEKGKPAAVPVVTAKEAEKLNEEAIEYAKPFENRSHYIKKGFKLVINDKLKRFQTVRPSSKQETVLSGKGYDLEEFKRRQIPHGWVLDIDNLPNAASFHNSSDGFFLDTERGKIRFLTKPQDSMRSSFFAEITIKNESLESACEIELGVQGSGINKSGYSFIKKEILAPGQETMLQWEISVYARYYEVRPVISINGVATLKEYNLYRYDHNEITLLEGEIGDRSSLPEPQTTDYPDCRYTAQFIGNSIISGSPCNKEVVLSVDGFIDKKVLPSNKLKPKDKIKCAIVPFDSVPEDLSGTQEADTLSLFELDSYLLLSYRTISSFGDYSETNLGVTFKDDDSVKKEYISIFKKQINPTLSEEEKNAQKDMIAQDLKKIEQLLISYSDETKQKINTEFKEAWNKEKAKDPPGTTNRIGRNVWRNMDNSFYVLPESHILINNYPEISQHNIESLVALKDFLESQGVQLIISLVPHFYDISARVINHDYSKLPDFRTAGVVKQLLDKGIEAIYASDDIIANYNKYENPFFYPLDAHPGDLPQDVLSDKVAERLSRFKISRQMDKEDFQSIKEEYYASWMALSNFSFPENCDIGKHQPGDFYSVSRIRYRNQAIGRDPNSQILVLGNSYSDVPEPISNYLTMKLGIKIYHYSVSGNGVLMTAIQRIFNNPESFLKNKKALVLSVGTVHLTGDITIPNIRELDSDAERLYNSKLISTIEPKGRETSIPEFALQLVNPAIFRTDGDGICSILDDSNSLLPDLDQSKDGFIVIYYCFAASTPFEIVANDLSFPLIGAAHSSLYFKQVIPIQKTENGISVKMVGKPNTLFAIGKIQIYQ